MLDIHLDGETTVRRLYKSINNGITWQTELNTVSGVDQKFEIEYSPESGLIYIGRLSLFIYNTENGELKKISYQTKDYHQDIRDIKILDYNNGYETVLIANDGGITKFIINKSNIYASNVENISGRFLTANNLIGIGVGNGPEIFAMAGGVHGNSLKAINNIAYPGGDSDGSDCLVHPEDETIFYHMSNSSIYRGIDNIYSGTVDDWFIGMRFDMDPNNFNKVYFGQQRAIGVYDDETETVTIKLTPNDNNNDKLNWVGAIEKSTAGILYLSDYKRAWGNYDYRLIKSANEGDNWIDMTQSIVHNIDGTTESLGLKLYGRTINTIESNPDSPYELWIGIGGIVQNTNGLVENTFRILHSQDGGQNWYEYSQGLTAFPVNYIYYHYPTEMLFAATDAGVFYRDPDDVNMVEWKCFSNNLPMGIVTDLDATDCNNMLYASIDGRGIYRTTIPFPIVNSEISIVYEDDYLVDGVEIWNDNRFFDGDIAIAPGASLRINGDITFTENGSITVMPGCELFIAGKLDIDQLCNNKILWKGIQIRGNANMPQTPQYQGSIRTLPGATICNAEIGIAAYGIDHNNNGNYIQDSQGGITIISDAVFINNKVGIDIRDYRYDNGIETTHAPVILNSKFKTYGIFYNDPMETPVHIQILNNNKVVVSQSDFYGERELLAYLPNLELKPTGIKTWNSPTHINDNKFQFLGYAIQGIDIMTAANLLEIDNNTFNDCAKSIHIIGHSNTIITRNTLTFGSSMQVDKTYLAYMDQCSNFVIEENTFAINKTALSVNANFCLIVNNCGTTNNSIYKNNFNDGFYGILAQNQNRDYVTHTGLSIKCNIFDQNVRNNITVTASGLSDNNGIAPAQGSMGTNPSDPAGNLFSNVFINPSNGLSSTDAHFWNLSNLNATVTYFHHDPNANGVPVYVRPGYTLNGSDYSYLNNGILRQTNEEADWNEYTCPSHLEGGGGDQKSRLQTSGENMDETSATLQSLVDAGNTQELNAEVQNADENEGFLLRNELISTSPYLSTEVLETAGNQEEVLTNPLLRDILVANPQSAKSEEVLSTVDNRTNPMPDYMKQQILNGQTYVAQKELLEAKLQTEKTEYSNAQIFVISKFLNDTSINPMDSLKPLLLSSKNPEAYFQLAGIYLIEGNFTETTNILNSIPVNFNLNNQQQEELSDITAFYGLLSTIYGENRSLNELNNAEMQDIWDWYNNENNNVVSVWARNILLFLGELEHTPEIVLPETDNNKSSLIKKPFNVEVPTDEYGSLKLYPNPTKDYIICNYKIMISYKNAYLLITESSSGKTKSTIVLNKDADQKTIDLSSFNSGNYILTLIIDDIEINSKKFSIIK